MYINSVHFLARCPKFCKPLKRISERCPSKQVSEAFCQNGLNFLRRIALQKKKNLTARVSMSLKSRASPDMLPFSLCNKKRLTIRYINRSLFPTTLSIPSYDIGKLVGLRTYQNPLVLMLVDVSLFTFP